MPLVFFTLSRVLRLTGVYTCPILPRPIFVCSPPLISALCVRPLGPVAIRSRPLVIRSRPLD
eukprot:2518791-Pyramimonas_sp.AAC.1